MALSSTAKELGSGIAALYRRYAEWLVSITWKRFIVLSILLLIVAGIASNIPPFTWIISERTVKSTKRVTPSRSDVDVKIDEHGVRITPKRNRPQAPEIIIDERGVQIRRKADPESGKPAEEIIIDEHGVRRTPATPGHPQVPPSSGNDDAGSITHELTRDVTREVTRQLAQDVRREVLDAIGEMGDRQAERIVRTRLGDFLPQLAFLFIMISAAIKIAYARTVKAEAKAA